jgi:hypothetical protein
MALWRPQSSPGPRMRRRHPASQQDKIHCRVCGFPVDLDTNPGEGFPTTFTVEGDTYVWTSADDSLSTVDKTVTPVTNPAVSCGFCGATDYMSGNRGTQ